MKNNDKFVIQKNKNTNRRIVIRTTDEIFEVAKENDISVNNLVVSCIRYALDHR